MMRLPCMFLLIAGMLLPGHAQVQVVVDENKQYQTIEGFGGFGAKKVWWEEGPYYDAEYLHETIDNLGVTIFRTQIYWDGEPVNDNDNPDVVNDSGFQFGPESDNGKQFPFIKALTGQGAKIIASVWTPPLWMKLMDEEKRIPKECYNCRTCAAGDEGRAMCGGRLNPVYYEEFAEYLVTYVKKLKQVTGVDLYAISIQNEPFFPNPFEANVVWPGEYGDILKVVAQRFDAEGLTTKFFGPEHMAEWSWGAQKKYVAETLGDPVVNPLLDIYAVHGYVDGVAADYGSAEGWTALHDNITVKYGKPLWMTETSDYNVKGYELAFSMSRSLYLALKFGRITAWVYWSMGGHMISDNKLTSLGYAFKNYYRFIRPGAVHIGAESSDAGVLTLAFRHPDTSDITVILINQTDTAKAVALKLPVSSKPLTLYRTSPSENCVDLGNLPSTTITLPPKSISTLTSTKGG